MLRIRGTLALNRLLTIVVVVALASCDRDQDNLRDRIDESMNGARQWYNTQPFAGPETDAMRDHAMQRLRAATRESLQRPELVNAFVHVAVDRHVLAFDWLQDVPDIDAVRLHDPHGDWHQMWELDPEILRGMREVDARRGVIYGDAVEVDLADRIGQPLELVLMREQRAVSNSRPLVWIIGNKPAD